MPRRGRRGRRAGRHSQLATLLIALLVAVPVAYLGLDAAGVFAVLREAVAPGTGARITVTSSIDPGSVDIVDAASGRAPRSITFTASVSGGQNVRPGSLVALEFPKSYTLSVANPLPYPLEFMPLNTVPEYCSTRAPTATTAARPTTAATTASPGATATTTRPPPPPLPPYLSYQPISLIPDYLRYQCAPGGTGGTTTTRLATTTRAVTTATVTATVSTATTAIVGPGGIADVVSGGQWDQAAFYGDDAGNYYRSPWISIPQGKYIVFYVTATHTEGALNPVYVCLAVDQGGCAVHESYSFPEGGATIRFSVSSYDPQLQFSRAQLRVWMATSHLVPSRFVARYTYEFRDRASPPPSTGATTAPSSLAKASVTIHSVEIEASPLVVGASTYSSSSGFADVAAPRSASVTVPIDLRAYPSQVIFVRTRYIYASVIYVYDPANPGPQTPFRIALVTGAGGSGLEVTVNLPGSAVVMDTTKDSVTFEDNVRLAGLLRISSPPLVVRSVSTNPTVGVLSFILENRHSQPASLSWRVLLGSGTYAEGSLQLGAGQSATVSANIARMVQDLRNWGRTGAEATLEVTLNYPQSDELTRMWLGGAQGWQYEPYNRRISLPIPVRLGPDAFRTEHLRVRVEGPGRIVGVEIVNEDTGEVRRYGAEGSYPYLYNPDPGSSRPVPQLARITVAPNTPQDFLCGYQANPPGYGPIRLCERTRGTPGRQETITVSLGMHPGFEMVFTFRSLTDPDVADARTRNTRLVNLMDRITVRSGGKVESFHSWVAGTLPDGRPDIYFSFRLSGWIEVTNRWDFPITVGARGGRVTFTESATNRDLSVHPFPQTTVQPGQTARFEWSMSAENLRLEDFRSAVLPIHLVADLSFQGPSVYEVVEGGRMIRLILEGHPSELYFVEYILPVFDRAYNERRQGWVNTYRPYEGPGTVTLTNTLIAGQAPTGTATGVARQTTTARAATTADRQPAPATDEGVQSYSRGYVWEGGSAPQAQTYGGAVNSYQEVALPASSTGGSGQTSQGYIRAIQAPPGVDLGRIQGQPAVRPAVPARAGPGPLDWLAGLFRGIGQAVLDFFRWLAGLLGLG